MNYLAYLFLSNMIHIEEETRYVCGKEQPCLIIPTEINQIKKGRQGNWLMLLRLAECPPNARMMTHELQQVYISPDIEAARRSGLLDRCKHMGRVYEHDRTPSKKIDRTNRSSDIKCDGFVMLSDIPKHLIFRNAENAKRYVKDIVLRNDADATTIYSGVICVDDIPAEYIETDQGTGKKYVRARFKKLVALDTYMNTHQLIILTNKGESVEIGRFKEWSKVGGAEIAPDVSTPDDERHTTSVNQRQMPHSIDGIKF